jgi:hypothetical protein
MLDLTAMGTEVPAEKNNSDTKAGVGEEGPA